MLIHGAMSAYGTESSYFEELFNSDEVKDGGFARVAPYTPATVLKATCCPATNTLFHILLQKQLTGIPVPHSVPAVLQHLPTTLKDSQGFVYEVWEVERLYGQDFYQEAQVARATQKHRFSQIKPTYSKTLARTSFKSLDALNTALSNARAMCGDQATWESSAEIALAMALQTTDALRDSFLFLREFVTCHQLGLDLLGRGNILLNMFGEPCIADPVQGECATGAPGAYVVEGACLGVLLPVRVDGRILELRPFVTFPLDAEVFSSIETKLREVGLVSHAFTWNSASLDRFLSQAPVLQSVHSLPGAAKHLRQDAYMQILCD